MADRAVLIDVQRDEDRRWYGTARIGFPRGGSFVHVLDEEDLRAED
ncbi:MAG: hypothetical protein M3P96_06345 [Actinomycetota bacterium]|nr:hypothetical protein [Actinomycetota bacterium]